MLALFSCKPEIVTEVDLTDIEGNWVLYEATRGGRSTRTLNGTYLRIMKDSISTNIFTDSQVYPCKREGSTLLIQSANPLLLTVESLANDSLYITSTFKNFDFEFFFKRTK